MAEITPVPLAELTTLQVGGTPARMIDANTRDELVDALREVWATEEPWFVLGGGSNMLVADGELPHTVVRVRSTGIERLDDPQPGVARVRVQAGHDWDDFVAWTVEHGLSGVEALSGIPGTVGAVPVQNVGAYGQEIAETLVEVELLDEETGDVSTVPAADLALGNRTSVLKAHHGSAPVRPAVVLTATFDLPVVGDGPRTIPGEQLRRALGLADADEVTLADIRSRVIGIRASKGMVLNPDDADTRSAGSFFQNPIVSEQVSRTLPTGCPRWPLPVAEPEPTAIPLVAYDGTVPEVAELPLPQVKVSAAWLIEQSGLSKGFRLGPSHASLSTKHTLALTNRGGATADEVAELARFVQSRVAAEHGVVLQPEPVFIGVEL